LREDGTRNCLWWLYERLEDLTVPCIRLKSLTHDERSAISHQSNQQEENKKLTS
jgi:hypothetical protein